MIRHAENSVRVSYHAETRTHPLTFVSSRSLIAATAPLLWPITIVFSEPYSEIFIRSSRMNGSQMDDFASYGSGMFSMSTDEKRPESVSCLCKEEYQFDWRIFVHPFPGRITARGSIDIILLKLGFEILRSYCVDNYILDVTLVAAEIMIVGWYLI